MDVKIREVVPVFKLHIKISAYNNIARKALIKNRSIARIYCKLL